MALGAELGGKDGRGAPRWGRGSKSLRCVLKHGGRQNVLSNNDLPSERSTGGMRNSIVNVNEGHSMGGELRVRPGQELGLEHKDKNRVGQGVRPRGEGAVAEPKEVGVQRENRDDLKLKKKHLRTQREKITTRGKNHVQKEKWELKRAEINHLQNAKTVKKKTYKKNSHRITLDKKQNSQNIHHTFQETTNLENTKTNTDTNTKKNYRTSWWSARESTQNVLQHRGKKGA